MRLRGFSGWGKALLRPVRNAWYRHWPRLRYRITGKKRILLYGNNRAMTAHIRRYAEPLLSSPACAFSLYEPEAASENDPADGFARFVAENRIPRVTRPGRCAWDLIVCADLRTPASFTRRMVPLLYVNHGLHLLSMDGGETLYAYGEYALGEDGEPKFTLMCEPSARVAEAVSRTNPRMAAVIRPVGYKFAEEMEAALACREETRRRLRVAPETCLVGLFGSWRAHSLFHALGPGIFDACLAQRERGYQFLFSVHPKEYGVYDPAIAPVGALVEAQRERGMLVRSPGEDFAPSLAATDIVISDFSSLTEAALLFGRKLIFSPCPEGMVWKHSLAAKARRTLPTLRRPDDLGALLDAVRAAPLHPLADEAREQLLRPDHDEIMREITEELLGLGPGPAPCRRRRGP